MKQHTLRNLYGISRYSISLPAFNSATVAGFIAYTLCFRYYLKKPNAVRLEECKGIQQNPLSSPPVWYDFILKKSNTAILE